MIDYVVFESEAPNLADWDTNHCMDIFLKDIQTETMTLVSVKQRAEIYKLEAKFSNQSSQN